MDRNCFCTNWPARLSLIALVASAVWPAIGLGYDGTADHWRRHDVVTISGSPAGSVTAGQTYSFTPIATDSFGRTLVFAVANLPSWATFNTASGQLSGTPSANSVGTYSNVVIAVSDGIKTATLPAFAVQVLGAAASLPPPTISGSPAASDVAGSAYSFQPSASGPNGMTLSFSIQNKPAWATFSIASGLLSGTPTSAQTGTYANVILSVSDGQASSALPSFSITVTAPNNTSGAATVNLTPPTQNTDGSALTDLGGMTVYYGSSPSSLTQQVQLPSPATSSTISNLASGTWYFGATAYTTTGLESAMTPVVSFTVQ